MRAICNNWRCQLYREGQGNITSEQQQFPSWLRVMMVEPERKPYNAPATPPGRKKRLVRGAGADRYLAQKRANYQQLRDWGYSCKFARDNSYIKKFNAIAKKHRG